MLPSARLRSRLRSKRPARHGQRSYISAITLTSSHPSQLLDALSSHLSPTTPDPGLPTATLLSFSQDLYPYISSSHASLLSSTNLSGALTSSSDPDLHTLSLARFYDTPSTSYVPFRSSSKANARAHVSVGRWRPLGEVPWEVASDGKDMSQAFEGGDWSRIWEQASSSEGDDSKGHAELTKALESLEDVKPESVRSIISFSTPSSTSTLLQDLSQLYPSATKAGSIVPQTPFTTGLPHTLFHNGIQHQDGAVGVAIVHRSSCASTSSPPALEVDWAGLEPLGDDVFVVSQSQGNLLLGLSLNPSTSSSSRASENSVTSTSTSSTSASSNPTQHLLRLLRLSSSPDLHNAQIGKAWLGGKEKDFYVGFLRDEEVEGGKIQVGRVVKVLSGDPSRGGMALDTEMSVKEGERFIFLHQPTTPSRATINDNLPSQSSTTLSEPAVSFTFRTSSSLTGTSSCSSPEAVDTQEGLFIASSEAGFVFGQASEPCSIDSGVPGGWARLRLD